MLTGSDNGTMHRRVGAFLASRHFHRRDPIRFHGTEKAIPGVKAVDCFRRECSKYRYSPSRSQHRKLGLLRTRTHAHTHTERERDTEADTGRKTDRPQGHPGEHLAGRGLGRALYPPESARAK